MNEIYIHNNYPALKRFTELLKEKDIKKTQKEIKEFLAKQTVSQLHKPVLQIKKDFKFITASAPNEIWQIDLLDYQKYSNINKGYNYILICVDIFTRKAKAIELKSKHTPNSADGFRKLLTNEKPQVVYSDDGNEWKGQFKSLLEKENIIHSVYDYGDHHSLGIIDRFSRTLKTMIAKHMTAKNTKKWVDELPHLIEIYNNSPHSGIQDIKPKDALKGDNKVKIATLNYRKVGHNIEIDGKINNIKKGDYVRVQIKKGTFQKGYEITYSTKIYNVISTSGLKATLDDGKDYKKTKLMQVDNNDSNKPSAQQTKIVERENKIINEQRVQKQVTKELGDTTIIPSRTRTIRKKKVKE